MLDSNRNDDYYMQKALEEAFIAFDEDEIPIGAVVVSNDRIIAKGHNSIEKLNDITAHAEMIAITAACNMFGSKYLENCKIYVTLEPCVMCASAIGNAQIKYIAYGTPDPKKGFNQYLPSVIHPKTIVRKEVLLAECSSLINSFFKKKRIK